MAVPCISIRVRVFDKSSGLCIRRPPGSLVDIMGELHGTSRDQRVILCDAYVHSSLIASSISLAVCDLHQTRDFILALRQTQIRHKR
jgi:hypothetical protein